MHPTNACDPSRRLPAASKLHWLTLILIACFGPAATSAEEGFRPLFDGESLEGWKQYGGQAEYAIEEGCIVGTSVPNTPNSFLCTEREYADFILEFEFKVDPRLNSGVQIRSQVFDREERVAVKGREMTIRPGVVHGYQVEIDPSSRAWSGGIYDESRRGWLFPLKNNPQAREAFQQNEWNHYRILCWGSTIQTWINGVPAAHLIDDVTRSGLIGLQVHGVGGDESKVGKQVRWRNLRIKEFNPVELDLYIGTYTGGTSEGIYRSRLHVETGELAAPQLVAKARNPSFVALDPTFQHLYAVSEISDLNGESTGGVMAFQITPEGSLKSLNSQPSGGGSPCHLIVDPSGQNVLVANYGGGSVACLPIDGETGELRPLSQLVQHAGSSVNPRRQSAPHAHSVNVDFNNRFAMVADLGLDKVLIYRFDPEQGSLEPNQPPSVSTPAGGGPRHFAWHPSGQFAYTNNEMTSAVTALRYESAEGRLTSLQTLSTLPEDSEVGNSTAEVLAHPSGRFLYVSNRGHNSIARFEIDTRTGKLTRLGHTSTQGEIPRNFAIDPSGRYLLAQNQKTNHVVVFRIDAETGDLQATGSEIEVGAPVCIRFAPVLKQ